MIIALLLDLANIVGGFLLAIALLGMLPGSAPTLAGVRRGWRRSAG